MTRKIEDEEVEVKDGEHVRVPFVMMDGAPRALVRDANNGIVEDDGTRAARATRNAEVKAALSDAWRQPLHPQNAEPREHPAPTGFDASVPASDEVKSALRDRDAHLRDAWKGGRAA